MSTKRQYADGPGAPRVQETDEEELASVKPGILYFEDSADELTPEQRAEHIAVARRNLASMLADYEENHAPIKPTDFEIRRAEAEAGAKKARARRAFLIYVCKHNGYPYEKLPGDEDYEDEQEQPPHKKRKVVVQSAPVKHEQHLAIQHEDEDNNGYDGDVDIDESEEDHEEEEDQEVVRPSKIAKSSKVIKPSRVAKASKVVKPRKVAKTKLKTITAADMVADYQFNMNAHVVAPTGGVMLSTATLNQMHKDEEVRMEQPRCNWCRKNKHPCSRCDGFMCTGCRVRKWEEGKACPQCIPETFVAPKPGKRPKYGR